MAQKQEIIYLFRKEGLSLREISRRLRLHRSTVTRVVREYERSLKAEDAAEALDEVLTTRPSYRQSASRPARALTPEVTSEIDSWLAENERRKARSMRKQCLNAKEIHRQLLEKDIVVSYSSVCKYISKVKAASSRPHAGKEVYIRQEYEPGVECEFDWGDVKLEIRGVQTTFTMAVFTFCHSNGRYAYIFRHQDTLALMEAHRNFFRDVHGVPEVMVYDNMRVAVAFTEAGKQPTTAMQRLTNFYRFAYRFCNARAGWEKGHVERSVEIVRSRAFKPRLKFDTVAEAQEWLTKICGHLNAESEGITAKGRPFKLREDIGALMPYPGEMGCFELVECGVDKLSTIVYKYNHYSVPDSLVGQHVFVKVYSERLVLYDDSHRKVAEHERSYLKSRWTLDINHYINTLLRKPGAIAGSTAMKQMPERMRNLYQNNFRENGRDFLLLLKHSSDNGYTYDDILAAAAALRRRGSRRLSLDQLKVAMDTLRHASDAIPPDVAGDDNYLEIAIGSEDILSQLTSMMGNQ